MLQFSIKIGKKLILQGFEKSQLTGSFLCPGRNGVLGHVLHLVVISSEVLSTNHHYIYPVNLFILFFVYYHALFPGK